MKRIVLFTIIMLPMCAGIALAERVRDWRQLDEAHKHILEAIHEMDGARAANHYDMQGHGAKAEQLLHEAERELHDAVESIKAEPAPTQKKAR